MNLQNDQVEIEVKKSIGGKIRGLRLFGEQEDRVIALTQDGYLILYNLDFSKSKGSMLDYSSIKMLGFRKEGGQSISVDDNNEYAFVEIGQSEHPCICSRMFVFKISGDSLIKKASIDQYSQSIGEKLAV